MNKPFVMSAISMAAAEWDGYVGEQLFGPYNLDQNAGFDTRLPNGQNEFSFGDYPESGVIAVTSIWGYFSGPPDQREIVEFDVLFDTDFP